MYAPRMNSVWIKNRRFGLGIIPALGYADVPQIVGIEAKSPIFCSYWVHPQGIYSNANTFKMALPNAYRDLQTVADKLYERSVTINNPDPYNPKLEQTKTRWINSIGYIPGDGELMITFAGPIIPYISMLEGRFTRYSIYSISDMNSTYGMRFYELMQKWRSESGVEKTHKEVKLVDLKSQLDLDTKYKSIKDFKKYVLEPAIKDINTHSDLKASYTQRKTGRRVIHLIFHFQPDEQLKMPLNNGNQKQPKITKTYIEKHAKPGESYEQAKQRLSKAGR